MGKRYVDEAGAEVLVTKAGAGTLTVGQTALSALCLLALSERPGITVQVIGFEYGLHPGGRGNFQRRVD